MQFLFVYGTLRPDLAPLRIRDVVKDLPLVGSGSTAGRLYDLGTYPGAIFESGPAVVKGIVLALPDPASRCESTLLQLDAYEGVDPLTPRNSLFIRVPVQVMLDDGRGFACWGYQYNRTPAGALIESGRYSPNKTLTLGPPV